MKRILSLICLLALTASAAAAQENGSVQNESSWQRYTVKGEDFSIKLPLLPAMATGIVFIEREQKLRRERRLGVYADGVVYTIYSLDAGQIQESYNDSIKEFRSSTAWDLNSEKDLTVAGFAGKQYWGVTRTVQVFATKKRVYQFQVVGAPGEDPRVKPFFASLMLGKKGEGIEVSDGQGSAYEPGPQSTPVSMEKSYTGKQVDRKAVLVMRIEPAYTEEARQRGVTGTVVLKAIFSAKGSVVNLVTVSGLPDGLTERAIDAARKIKFIPAVKDGKFVSMWIQLEYNFNLY